MRRCQESKTNVQILKVKRKYLLLGTVTLRENLINCLSDWLMPNTDLFAFKYSINSVGYVFNKYVFISLS